MSTVPRSTLNTLSEARKRIVPSTFDFAGLTLNLEKAAAKARNSPDANLRKQFQPSKSSSMLDRLAARPPSSATRTATPILPRSREAGQFGRRTPPASQLRSAADQNKLNATRSRLSLPDPSKVAPRSSPRVATEFTREVSALDRLAAEAGVAGKSGDASTIKPRRSYKDRLEVRPEGRPAQTSTRFALPRRTPGSSPSRRPGAQTKTPGQSPVRRQTRAQEEEETRRAAVEARKAAARPQPVAYSYEGLDLASFSPVLSTLKKNGSITTYQRFQDLTKDERDPVRLVAGNRSIVHKQTVLKKIDTWIPPPPPSSSTTTSVEI